MSTERITLRHIAEASGFSVNTVSLALRNSPRLPETTRSKVRAVAEQLGYRPDPRVNELMAHLRLAKKQPAQPVLAVIYWERKGNAPSVGGLYQGALIRASELGYRLERFFLSDENESARLDRILRHRGIRGVVIAPARNPGTMVRLSWEHYAAIGIGHSLDLPGLDIVTNHQVHAVRLCFEKLRSKGHRRIGMILRRKVDARTEGNYRAGYLLEQSKLPTRDRIAIYAPERIDPRKALDWVQRTKCQGLILAGSSLGRLFPRWTAEDGRSFPEMVTTHLLSLPGVIAGVDQRESAIGAAAVDLVAARLQINRFGLPAVPATTLIEGKWTEPPDEPE